MLTQRRNLYVACENMNFVWDERDITSIDQMWKEGLSVWDISRAYDRDPDEVAVLIMDRKRLGSIKDRPGGAMGRRMNVAMGGKAHEKTNAANTPAEDGN